MSADVVEDEYHDAGTDSELDFLCVGVGVQILFPNRETASAGSVGEHQVIEQTEPAVLVQTEVGSLEELQLNVSRTGLDVFEGEKRIVAE